MIKITVFSLNVNILLIIKFLGKTRKYLLFPSLTKYFVTLLRLFLHNMKKQRYWG